ncbi:MAG: HD domain-containing phosphohydrolase [Halothermotrichaceae bacterium]
MQYFASRLKKLRKERNLSQEKLANDLGYSRTTISNYEQDARIPPADILYKIADYFCVSIDYLLGRTNFKTSIDNYLSNNAGNIILFIDTKTGQIINHTPAALSFYNISSKELLNKTIYDINNLPDQQIKSFMKNAKEKEQYTFNLKHRTFTGEIKDVQSTVFVFSLNNRNILCSIIEDNSKKKDKSIINNHSIDDLFYTIGKISLHRTPYKKTHARDVAHLSAKIAKQLGMPDFKQESLWIAGLLHDIGEIYIPDDILNKPGKLTANEFNLVKEHPQNGYKLIKDIVVNQLIKETILQHHERMDGSGYPNGLTDNNILLEAKILAVADVFSALTSYRPHRKSYSIQNALYKIKKNTNIKFDKKVVDELMKLMSCS